MSLNTEVERLTPATKARLSVAAKADLLLILVTLLAALSWVFSREAVMLMPPLLFMAMRFLLASLILAVFGYKQLCTINVSALRRSILVGVVFAAGMCCWVMGIFYGHHVGEGAFLTSLGVALVPVFAALVFREVQPITTWLSLPVVATGLALLSLKHGFRPELGQVFYMLAAVIFAFYYILNSRAANARTDSALSLSGVAEERVPALALTTIVLLMVGLISALLSFLFEPWLQALSHWSSAMVFWILLSAVLGSALRFLIQTYAQSLSRHTHGNIIMMVEPVWVALLAALYFGETMTQQQLTGCFLIFAGLLVSRVLALLNSRV